MSPCLCQQQQYQVFQDQMNTIVEELKSQPTMKTFLNKYLQYLGQYFKKATNISEDKTYLRIKKIADKIMSFFPLHHCVRNVSNKLIKNVKERVDDKFENTSDSENLDLHNFIINLSRRPTDTDGGRNVDESWLKKLLLEEISMLKQQLVEINDLLIQNLKPKIITKSKIIYLDSFNSNKSIVEQLCKEKNASLLVIGKENDNKGKIDIRGAGRQVKKANLLIISSTSILKNGGVLVESGGLMLMVAAKEYNVPVIILNQGYCFTDNLIMNQNEMINWENPMKYFPQEQNSEMKVHIGKNSDYVEPSLINQLVNEEGCWSPDNVMHMFSKYYD